MAYQRWATAKVAKKMTAIDLHQCDFLIDRGSARHPSTVSRATARKMVQPSPLLIYMGLPDGQHNPLG
jgi:hypothetical protein